MNAVQKCQICSTPIPTDAPAGSCPQCLMAMGMPGRTPVSSGYDATLPLSGRPLPVPDSAQLVGRFPNLEIQHLIGQGGMGAVYQARQTNLDRTVALKILSPQLNDDPAFAERFTREALTLAKLTHPNIVTVFDFGRADSMHYLVMEFIDGVNLRDTIQSTKFSSDQALSAIGQICDALQYAHDAGVVHRDIKPENILVNKQGLVKIADFGLAKLLEPSPEEFTLTGTRQVMGTLKYMAPEQIEKPDQVDHRADLYSLGVVFYELLTGELPIGRFAVPSAKAEINSRLDDVVLKTLEKEPDERYQQASEIKTAVAAAELQPPVEALPDPPVAPSGLRSPALPFKTDDVYGGMASGFGIARVCEPDTLEIEFEIQDCLGATKSAAKTVNIPISKLSTIQFKPGLFSDTISIQADTMAVVTDIPSAKHGLLRLYTAKSDVKNAYALITHVQDLMVPKRGQAAPIAATAPTAPVKSSTRSSDAEGEAIVTNQLRWPAAGMLLAGTIYLVLAAFLLFAMTRTMLGGDSWVDLTCGKILMLLGQVLFVETGGQMLGTAVLSSVFALAALRARSLVLSRRRYGIATFWSLVSCIPLHPLCLITIPSAVWFMIVMDKPLTRRSFEMQTVRANAARADDPTSGTRIFVMAVLLPLAFLLGLVIILGSIALVAYRGFAPQINVDPKIERITPIEQVTPDTTSAESTTGAPGNVKSTQAETITVAPSDDETTQSKSTHIGTGSNIGKGSNVGTGSNVSASAESTTAESTPDASTSSKNESSSAAATSSENESTTAEPTTGENELTSGEPTGNEDESPIGDDDTKTGEATSEESPSGESADSTGNHPVSGNNTTTGDDDAKSDQPTSEESTSVNDESLAG